MSDILSKGSAGSHDILVRAKNLGCRRGERLLFSEISFLLKRGNALRIVGANGSGKTSLLKILCGLLPPESGKIEIRAPFHFLGHKDALADELTPLEMLLWYRSVLKTDKQAVVADPDEIIASFHLKNLRDTPCGELSAGQRKLVGLAKLLFLPRPLWILDEPFASLSSFFITHVQAMLAEHRKGGGGVIYSDHSGSYTDAPELKLTFEPE